jgi:hypothetical protein
MCRQAEVLVHAHEDAEQDAGDREQDGGANSEVRSQKSEH